MSENKKALFQTALRFLSYRDRFKKEIETYLRKEIKKKFPKESTDLISGILTKLEKAGLINDQDLIDRYIETQQKNKLRGPHAIRPRLIRLGAPKNLVNISIKKLITNKSQEEIIEKLIKKLKPNLKNSKILAKFYRRLIYQGFDLSIIRQKIAFCKHKE